MLPLSLLAVSCAVFFPSLVLSYSFNIASTPRQCQTLDFNISGSGQPPYNLLILPFGPSPLPNNIEARTIVQQNFTGSSTSFQLKYPTNSHFLAVLSDSSGFGSGGTSVAATVLNSSDASCYDASTNVQGDFTFKMDPPDTLVQCTSTRLWWDPSDPQGTPVFYGVIPGGESFIIPQGSITNVVGTGTGFSWTPSLRGGTQLIITCGDNRGPGTGGSVPFTVSSGTDNDGSCLNSNSPSSTPGSPAGGSYPTSTSGAGTGGSDSDTGGGGGGGGGTTSGGNNTSSTNVGAIVGGVIGGIAGLVTLGLIILFLFRRRRFHKSTKERPVDLLHEDSNDAEGNGHTLPQYYRPEPFVVPDPTDVSSANAQEEGGEESGRRYGDRRGSTTTVSTGDLLTPSAVASSQTGKSRRPQSLRPVNVVQHEDAGPPDNATSTEPETVELPPAYTNLRR